MSRKYKFIDQTHPYFISFAVINWIDVFTRNQYKDILIKSWQYCQQHIGLLIHVWVEQSPDSNRLIKDIRTEIELPSHESSFCWNSS